MRQTMTAQFAAALASGRLRPAPLATTLDLGIGFQIMTIRRVLDDGGDRTATIAMATEALLLALGASAQDAADVAQATDGVEREAEQSGET